MNHCTNVADLETFIGYRRGQYHPIVFFDHAEGYSLPGYAVTSRGAS
jgi:hypothetical protein